MFLSNTLFGKNNVFVPKLKKMTLILFVFPLGYGLLLGPALNGSHLFTTIFISLNFKRRKNLLRAGKK